jgi:hypothetical protein
LLQKEKKKISWTDWLFVSVFFVFPFVSFSQFLILVVASANGHAEVVALLVAFGADLTVCDYDALCCTLIVVFVFDLFIVRVVVSVFSFCEFVLISRFRTVVVRSRETWPRAWPQTPISCLRRCEVFSISFFLSFFLSSSSSSSV